MTSQHDECPFCRIVAGEIPAEILASDDDALAFRDLDPKAPTHVLVIPRTHSPTLPELAEIDPGAAAAVLRLARRIALAEGLADGYRCVFNNGAGAQQSVFHAHVHVLGGRPFSWPPG